MPYDGELAKHGVLIDFAENELIKEMLENSDVKEGEGGHLPPTLLHVQRAQWQPGQVFAIDGSIGNSDIFRPIGVRSPTLFSAPRTHS